MALPPDMIVVCLAAVGSFQLWFFLVVVLSSFNHKWYSVVCIRIVPVTGPYELACIILYRPV